LPALEKPFGVPVVTLREPLPKLKKLGMDEKMGAT
jgi:hypothetical protein